MPMETHREVVTGPITTHLLGAGRYRVMAVGVRVEFTANWKDHHWNVDVYSRNIDLWRAESLAHQAIGDTHA